MVNVHIVETRENYIRATFVDPKHNRNDCTVICVPYRVLIYIDRVVEACVPEHIAMEGMLAEYDTDGPVTIYNMLKQVSNFVEEDTMSFGDNWSANVPYFPAKT